MLKTASFETHSDHKWQTKEQRQEGLVSLHAMATKEDNLRRRYVIMPYIYKNVIYCHVTYTPVLLAMREVAYFLRLFATELTPSMVRTYLHSFEPDE